MNIPVFHIYKLCTSSDLILYTFQCVAFPIEYKNVLFPLKLALCSFIRNIFNVIKNHEAKKISTIKGPRTMAYESYCIYIYRYIHRYTFILNGPLQDCFLSSTKEYTLVVCICRKRYLRLLATNYNHEHCYHHGIWSMRHTAISCVCAL